MQQPRLLVKVLAAVLPVAIAALLLIWWSTARSIDARVRAQVDQRLALEAQQAADQLNARFETLKQTAQALAQNALVVNGLSDQQAQSVYLSLLFESMQVPGPKGAAISLIDYRGRTITSNHRNHNYFNAWWLTDLLNGEAHVSVSREAMVIAAPVFFDGNVEGAVVLEYRGVHRVAEFLDLAAHQIFATAVLAPNDEVLFSSDEEFVRFGQPFEGQDASAWLSAMAWVSGAPGVCVVAAERKTQALAPVAAIRDSSLVNLLLSLAALICGIVIATLLATLPLAKLASGILSLKIGNQTKGKLPPQKTRELQTLADSFEFMLNNLEQVTVSRDQVERIIDSIAELLLVTDLSGHIDQCNKATVQITGCSAALLQAQTVSKILQDEQGIPLGAKRLFEAAREHQSLRGWCIGTGRKSVPMSITVKAMSGSGLDDRYIIVAVDEREQRQVENTLRASERRMHDILESVAEAVAVFDERDRLVFANTAYRYLLGDHAESVVKGESFETLLRRYFSNVIAEDKDVEAMVRQRVELCRSNQSSFQYQTRHGTAHLARERRMPDGSFVLTIGDITELRRSTSRLKQSHLELQHFANAAAQIMTEPLHTITGQLQALRKRHSDENGEQIVDDIDKSIAATEQLQRLSEELFEFLLAGSSVYRYEPVNLQTVMETLRLSMVQQLEACGAELTNDVLPQVYGNAQQFEQLLRHLIDNALKFNRSAAPRVHIGVEARGDRWLISVEDNGVGIDQVKQAKVFSPFHQVQTRGGKLHGSIGLATCKRIVECLDGKIWIHSEPGLGTTVYFTVGAVLPSCLPEITTG